MSDGPLDPVVLDTLRKLTMPGEPDVLREVLQLFQEDVPGRLERLRQAVDEGDLVKAERAAHSIKGSAGNIGATALHDACRDVENAARAKNEERTRLGMDVLNGEASRVAAAVTSLLS
jgi:HPt (histidine-containing phosphotransfer) domain-containing protein